MAHRASLSRRISALMLGLSCVSCAPNAAPNLTISRLALAEGDIDCGDGPTPVSTTDVAILHLQLTHPERPTFEQRVDIEPGARSVQVGSIPVGEDWDVRLTGFQSAANFSAGTYSWLGRRAGVDVAADQSTGAGILLLRVEALQCTRAPMAQPNMLSVATTLKDGRVLLTGGIDAFSVADCEGCRWGEASRRAILYDPVTGSFSATASMPDARVGHAASLDGSGRVLIVGGAQRVRLGGEHSVDLGDAGLRDSSLLFDPATERWTEVETLWGQRAFHTLTLLNDGSLITAGGFADRGRIHSDVLRLSVTEDSVRLVETAEAMRCPRVGHQAFRYQDEVVLWGGSRCTDSDQSAPEIWSPRAGLRLADTERWGSEANLSFATSVELQTGTFLIAGGSVYRDGSLQTPNRENSYYFLAETETHVRAVMLPEGIPALFASAVRLSRGRRAWLGGGFADLQFNEPRHGYTLFDDNADGFQFAAQLPGLAGGITASHAGTNQVLIAGGASACSDCSPGLRLLNSAAVFSSAEDH